MFHLEPNHRYTGTFRTDPSTDADTAALEEEDDGLQNLRDAMDTYAEALGRPRMELE